MRCPHLPTKPAVSIRVASGSSAVPPNSARPAHFVPAPGTSLPTPLTRSALRSSHRRGGVGRAGPGSSGSRLRGSPCLPAAPPRPIHSEGRSAGRARAAPPGGREVQVTLRGPRCAVGVGGGGRWLTRQRGRRREWFPAASERRARSRPSAPHPSHQEGAALSARSVFRPEGGLSSGGDLAGGFEEDCPQPTFPRTPLSRDPGGPAWGWGWEGVRSRPLYIRGPRPSEGTPGTRICPRRGDGAGEGCGWGLDLKVFFCFFLGFGRGAGEEGRVQRIKKRRSSSCSQGPFNFASVRCPAASLLGPHTGSQCAVTRERSLFSLMQSRPRL